MFTFVFFLLVYLYIHSTYTVKVQMNELIKLHVHTIYKSTVTRQMELTGKTDFNIGTTDYFCFSELGNHM